MRIWSHAWRYRWIIGAAQSFARLPFHGFGADAAPGRQRTHRVLNFVSAGCLLVSHKPLDTESLEDLFTSVGSPLRSTSTTAQAEGVSTAAGLEGAWSTRVASRTRGPQGRPPPPPRAPSGRERRPSLRRRGRPRCFRLCRPGALCSCPSSPRTCDDDLLERRRRVRVLDYKWSRDLEI